MRLHFKRLATALAGATVLTAAALSPALAETIELTILGAGDLYNFAGVKDRGGFARLNTVAKQEAAAHKNFLYVFDGDMLSPSLLSGIDKGENTVELTNLFPFDIAVPGNHEFDFGPENFVEKAKETKYPWRAVNIFNPDGTPLLEGTLVKEIAGLKIALVPVAQDTTPVVSSSGDLIFKDSVKTGIAAAQDARANGADLVVGVVQVPHNQDRELMASHAFDVIMSGDDHDYMTGYDGITAYVETSTEAKYLAPLDLTINVEEKDGKKKISWTPTFRFIDTATVTPDPEAQQLVDKFKADLDKSLNVEIGTTETKLDSRRNMVRTQETSMGDMIADAMRAANGADIAITNGGGIRADRTYDAGTKLTRRDILTELPFGNVTVVTEVTGKDVLAALENGFSQVENGAGRFPQVSGMKIEVDLKKPAGERVVSVMIDGKPLDPTAKYKVATNDYMMAGGDGYTALSGGQVLISPNNGNLMANDVMNYVAATGKVAPKVEGRIVEK